jgi:hypothetical protein
VEVIDKASTSYLTTAINWHPLHITGRRNRALAAGLRFAHGFGCSGTVEHDSISWRSMRTPVAAATAPVMTAAHTTP